MKQFNTIRSGTSMTNNGITTGDLVAVVRGHSCIVNSVGGIPFTVRKVESVLTPGAHFVCQRCKYEQSADGVQFVSDRHGNVVPLSWLKKFPPLDVKNSVGEHRRAPVSHYEK
jgi:hypothetical protein